MLIIVCGLPGSGKSSLSRKLKQKLPAVYLNTDIIRKHITSKPQYTEEEKRMVYSEMANRAEKNVNMGRNVVVDATFYSKKYRNMMKNITKDHYIVLCALPEKLIRERLKRREQRKNGVSDAGYDVYLALKEKFEPIEGDYLEVDCSLPKTKQVELVLEYIGGKRGR